MRERKGVRSQVIGKGWLCWPTMAYSEGTTNGGNMEREPETRYGAHQPGPPSEYAQAWFVNPSKRLRTAVWVASWVGVLTEVSLVPAGYNVPNIVFTTFIGVGMAFALMHPWTRGAFVRIISVCSIWALFTFLYSHEVAWSIATHACYVLLILLLQIPALYLTYTPFTANTTKPGGLSST